MAALTPHAMLYWRAAHRRQDAAFHGYMRSGPMPEQEYIVVERDEPIAVVTINRPDKLNALNWGLVSELADQLEALDRDEAIRCIVLTGAGNKAFAAGADIAEMSNATPVQMATGSFQSWDRIRRVATPIIAAVG